jgi:hypothetical protein
MNEELFSLERENLVRFSIWVSIYLTMFDDHEFFLQDMKYVPELT